eukprot:403370383
MVEPVDIKKFVNEIFAKKGIPAVKNFAKEFSDGILFQSLFNILYDEKVDCKLEKSNLVEQKCLNWNKINASICFNYLQQQFYLVKPSMKALAKGNNEEVIIKLLKNLINCTQSNYHDTYLDDAGIRDIADVMQTEQPLYGVDEDPSVIETQSQRSASKKSTLTGKRSEQFAHLEEQLQQLQNSQIQ